MCFLLCTITIIILIIITIIIIIIIIFFFFFFFAVHVQLRQPLYEHESSRDRVVVELLTVCQQMEAVLRFQSSVRVFLSNDCYVVDFIFGLFSRPSLSFIYLFIYLFILPFFFFFSFCFKDVAADQARAQQTHAGAAGPSA